MLLSNIYVLFFNFFVHNVLSLHMCPHVFFLYICSIPKFLCPHTLFTSLSHTPSRSLSTCSRSLCTFVHNVLIFFACVHMPSSYTSIYSVPSHHFCPNVLVLCLCPHSTICTSSFYIAIHHVLSLSVPLSVMSYSFTCVHIVFLICTCVHMSSSDTSDYSVLHKHCSVPCLLPLSLSPLYSFSSFIYITVHHLSSYIFVHHFCFLHVCSVYSFTVFAMSSSFTFVQCPLPMFLSTMSPPIHTAFFLYHNHTLLPHLCPPCPFLTSVHHVPSLYICLL